VLQTTDDRQTDNRQTDGRATANREREGEFTFAKNVLSSNISSTCPHNIANFGPLTAEIGSVVLGLPSKCQLVSCLANWLLHGILVVGVSQTLRH